MTLEVTVSITAISKYILWVSKQIFVLKYIDMISFRFVLFQNSHMGMAYTDITSLTTRER